MLPIHFAVLFKRAINPWRNSMALNKNSKLLHDMIKKSSHNFIAFCLGINNGLDWILHGLEKS